MDAINVNGAIGSQDLLTGQDISSADTPSNKQKNNILFVEIERHYLLFCNTYINDSLVDICLLIDKLCVSERDFSPTQIKVREIFLLLKSM